MATQRQNIFRRMTSVVKRAKPWLCFTAEAANSTFRLDKVGSPDLVSLETSTNGKAWATYSWSGNTGATIQLPNIGDKVYWRAIGTNSTFSKDTSNYYSFKMGGSISASGSVMSLLGAGKGHLQEYSFYLLFGGCPSLTKAPDLPATELISRCYQSMFVYCTSLTKAPDLPATELASYCYYNMFSGCTALTVVPDLPATELASNCYQTMFQNCTALSSIKVGFNTWMANTKYEWLKNVSPSGTFYCSDELPEPTRGVSTIPDGWTIVRPSDRYEQRGLVFQLDCKRGVDATNKTWTDLKGNVVLSILGDSISQDSQGGIYNICQSNAVLTQAIADGYTIEVCTRSVDYEQQKALLSLFASGDSTIKDNIGWLCYSFSEESFVVFNVCQDVQRIYSINTVDGVATFYGGNGVCEVNGVLYTTYEESSEYQIEPNGTALGTSGSTLMGSNPIYSIRIYNRALTAAERAHNRQIDKERFGQ